MYSPQMPGSFNFDYIAAAPPKLDLNAGVTGSQVFQPPRTPSAASSLSRSITSDTFSTASQNTRKRQRFEFVHDGEETPGLFSAGTASPAMLANSQYSLADGLDTPTALTAAAYEKHAFDQYNAENDYRRNRGDQYSHFGDGYFPSSPAGPLSRERNGRTRTSQLSTPNKWPRTVINVVGNVAGKVWEFCWAGAFRGFYSGGGTGYLMSQSNGWQPRSEKGDVFKDDYRELTPVPGGFPEDDLIPDYMLYNHTTTTPPRAAKKVLRERSDSGLRGSWVMVNNTPHSRDGSPIRTSHRKVPRQERLSLRRPVTASRPGKRTILAPSRPSLMCHTGSPAFHSSRPTSSASNRPSGTPTLKPTPKPDSTNSPLSPEARKNISLARKRERQDDASIRRMTQQLDALIKQGREALGTKVEVEEDGKEDAVDDDSVVDEGYAEGGVEFGLERRKPWDTPVFDGKGRRWR